MTRPSATSPWPNSAKGCISITLDNMGEAADIHRGLWDPSTQPVGSHYSVTESLPTMLSLLSQHSIPASYYIEAWNCSIYPSTITSLSRDHGLEVGYHAWQHEVWSLLSPATEAGNLQKSLKALDGLHAGLRYRGFRPPGGKITPRTLALLRDNGFTYLSPAASRCAVVDDVAVVPFQWRDIDAYFYLPSLAPVRTAAGDGEECLSPAVFRERLLRRVDEVAEGKEGGFAAFLFHPFLTNDEERVGVMRDVLEYVAKKREEGTIWVAKGEEVAEWVRAHGEEFGSDPGWDTAEWKKK